MPDGAWWYRGVGTNGLGDNMIRCVALASLTAMGLCLATGAQASEVLYDGIAGSTVTITATDLTNSSILIGLTNNVWSLATGIASQAGFDAAGLTLDSFVFSTSGMTTVTSPAGFAGTTINLTSVSLNSTGPTPVSNLGGGDYQFTNAGATVSAMYSVNGGAPKVLTGGGTSGLGGVVGLGGQDTLEVNGITLGTITVGGQIISLDANIAFDGAQVVPLPAAAWLFASGLGLLGLPAMRRRVRSVAVGAGHALVGAGLAAAVLGLALVPRASVASTVTVSGGGLDAGALCAIGALCPTNPVNGYGYGSGGAVTGTLDYNTSTDLADFSFTLSANTFFGTEELLAGSTFSATAIPITVSTSNGVQTISLGSPALDATTSNVQFISPALTMIENTPSLAAFRCQLTSASGLCGVSLGSANGSGNALEFVDASNNDYNAYLTFSVNVVPVPVPAALPLFLSGLAGLGAIAKKRVQRPA